MASEQPVRAGTLKRVMADLAYFKGWDVGRVKAIEGQARLVDLDAKETLFDVEALDPYDYFLLALQVLSADILFSWYAKYAMGLCKVSRSHSHAVAVP